MATSSTPESAPKVVKIQRFQIGLNVILQTLVIVGILLMLNYIAFRHFKRWDFSRDKKYELSSQTRSLLKNLQKPVKAVVFFSSAAEIAPDVASLLREYEYASDKKFQAEFVDPYRSLTRAQELQSKYKFGANENIVILDIAGKSKFVNAADMADFEAPDQMAAMMGQTQPRLKDFKGEQAITSALLELTQGKASKVYFVEGHGEPDLNSPDLKVFTESLKRQNIQIAPLNLLNVNNIPADASSLIICGPKYDYSELEVKLINDFWDKKGRFFVLLNPFAKTDRLTGWLNAQGVVPQEDRVLRTGTFLKMDDQGKPQLTTGVIADPSFVVLDSHTKITKDLEGLSKKLLGATESLQIDQSREVIAKVHVIPLLQSAEGFWGETNLTSGDDKVFFDPKKDHIGPLNLAVAVEKGGVEDQRVKMDSSRLVVVGNAELLGNNDYRLSEGVSADITVNVLNWLLDREDVMGIPPKEKKNVTLSFDEKQLFNLKLTLMGIIPGIVALFGLFNWWLRRS
ncbi:MAG: Gldg family protein [Chthoniobacter sp.]|nr:Gldg family protein [Chthoniobacter sp.]